MAVYANLCMMVNLIKHLSTLLDRAQGLVPVLVVLQVRKEPVQEVALDNLWLLQQVLEEVWPVQKLAEPQVLGLVHQD